MIKYSQQPINSDHSLTETIKPTKAATPPEPVGSDPMAEDDQEQD